MSPTPRMLQLPRGSPVQEVPGGWSSFSCFCAPWAEHPQLPARVPGFSLWKSPALLLLKSKVGENHALTNLAGSSLTSATSLTVRGMEECGDISARGWAGQSSSSLTASETLPEAGLVEGSGAAGAHGCRGCAGLRLQPSEPAAASPPQPELLGCRQGHRSLPHPRRPRYVHGESLC